MCDPGFLWFVVVVVVVVVFVCFFVFVVVLGFFHTTKEVVTFCLCGWCVLGGCIFVAGIHPSRTWMSGSFVSERWNTCLQRLDLGLYSHPEEFREERSQNPC